MNYITVKEAAEKWDCNIRQVQRYCSAGVIPGVRKLGAYWMIPENAAKPVLVDGRTKRAKETRDKGDWHLPMPRKSPFLDMTDLYTVPGSANKCIEGLAAHTEAQTLFATEIAYSRGEIDKVYEHAQYLLKAHSGMYAVISGGMLLALCAMWNGDVLLWRKARKHICEAPCRDDNDRDILALSLACIDTAIRNLSDYPDWFKRGCFEHLPQDAHPAARVFYIKYLLVFAQEMAKGEFKLPDVTGLGLMKSQPYFIEPMIAQAVVDRTIIPEIYLRLLCAIAYHCLGEDDKAIPHIDKAITLALPDNLLGILAEHRRQFDSLLDERLKLADVTAYNNYIKLHKKLLNGWTKLHNTILDKQVSIRLSIREREIARLAAFNMRDKEIAARLHISIHTVKSAITSIINKTGASDRSEFGSYI